jgi:hypothetical protein
MPSSHKSHKSHKPRSLKASGKRSFTINRAFHVDGCPTKFSHNDYTGRYHNSSPHRAARKALNHLCRVKRIRGQCTLYIEMRETTQGSKHKIFAYKAKRIHLGTPLVVSNRTYNYTSKVMSVKQVPTDKCRGSHKSSGPMVGQHSNMLRSKKHHTKKHSRSHIKHGKTLRKTAKRS